MRGVFHMNHMFHMSHVLSLKSLTWDSCFLDSSQPAMRGCEQKISLFPLPFLIPFFSFLIYEGTKMKDLYLYGCKLLGLSFTLSTSNSICSTQNEALMLNLPLQVSVHGLAIPNHRHFLLVRAGGLVWRTISRRRSAMRLRDSMRTDSSLFVD